MVYYLVEGLSVRASERHQLKQDRFAEATKETFDWTVTHRKNLVIGAVVVAIILIAAIGSWAYLQRREEAASLELGRAMRTFNAQLRPEGTPAQPGVLSFTSSKERYEAAIREFQNIADEYKLTRSGDIARYYVGVTALQMGDFKRAETQLKDSSDRGNAEIASLAKYALANLYRLQNRPDEAIRLLKELADKPTHAVSKNVARLDMAELYQQKDPNEARRIYTEIVKDSPNTPAAEVAQQRLAGPSLE
jgi:predicted negative regulator of RcsB-dependent stress response